MFKAGRVTAALLLVAIGGMLLIDQSQGTNYLSLLVDWWPVILILIGVEYLLATLLHHRSEKRVGLDYGGIFLSVLIALLVVSATQSSSFASRIWNSLIDGDVFSLSDESGIKIEKGVTRIPLTGDTEGFLLENPNGAVVLRAGEVDDIEIETTMYISKLEKDKAQQIADRSSIVFSAGRTLKITAEGEKYNIFGIGHKPRMNLVVTVPMQRELDVELKLTNGKIEAENIPAKALFKAATSNGSIRLSGIAADVVGETTNGRVDISAIQGSVSIQTTNGSMTAGDVDGSLEIETTNGNLGMLNVAGFIEAEPADAKIDLREAAKNVRLETTNGSISVSSHTVGGDWDLETTIGAISLYLPEDGDFTVSGDSGLGKNSSEFPLALDRHEIKGSVGSGKHRIKMDTNGSIDIYKID